MTDQYAKNIAQQRTYRAFATLLAGDDEAIDLVQAALLIASTQYPDLDIAYYTAQLDNLARRVRTELALPTPDLEPTLPEEIETPHVIEAMNKVLFEEEHFRGNREDYHNPNNSFLNKVLEEHTGIPITLCLIYAEVGKRVGIQIDGIGMPYHFLVRCQSPEGFIYIDPYEEGLQMSERSCRERFRQMAQHRIKFHAHWLEPFTRRHWLMRILNNLKRVYINQDDYDRALTTCDLLIMLNSRTAEEWRDRGLINLQLKRYSHAIKDLKTYTELAPEASDHHEILNYIKTAHQMLAMLN
ncbi:MAG TPA: transglutaminase-like domain-containing protein [Ktedonobacteraceae bacterium]|jgi:regulator of sirC expression with transglutaminase-like and TPR domain